MIAAADESIAAIQADYYNKFTNGVNITTDSAEFNQDEFYSDLGEITSSDINTIKLNDIEYDNSNKKVSIGNNANISAPIFTVTDANHLLVSTLHLAANAKDGIVLVEAGDNAYEVTLEGLDNGDTLTLAGAEGLATQPGRINEVTVDGTTITQVSNNGRHAIGVMLEADGSLINDTNAVIYTISANGNMGMTAPESLDGSDIYSYVVYVRYVNGDFTADNAKTYTLDRKIVVPGQGNITLTFVLEAQEYVA